MKFSLLVSLLIFGVTGLQALENLQSLEKEKVEEKFGGKSAAECGSCHPRHHKEWLNSVHASVKRTLPLPEMIDGRRSFEAPECTSCHGEDLTQVAGLGEKALEHPVILSHQTEATISCTVCHQIPDPFEGLTEAIKNGDPEGEKGRYRKRFHQSKPIPALSRAESCGPCHEVKSPNGLKLEQTFSQYLASAYPKRNITCADCHMASYGGTLIPGGFFREQVHRHDFIGSDSFVNTVPAIGSQKDRVQKFLAASATLFVSAPEKVVPSKGLPLVLEIVNSGAGHNVPVGFPGERRMWLEIEVKSKDGEVDYSLGTSQRPQSQVRSLKSEQEINPLEKDLVFHDRFLNAEGKEVDFWWEAKEIETRSIKALDRKRLELDLPISNLKIGQELSIEVRLRFQACSPKAMARQGLEELIQDHPVFDLHTRKITPVEVVERLQPPGWILVPEDVQEIQEAIDKANDGGVISLAPGDYELSESLNLKGKSIRIFGRAGQEQTRLVMDLNEEDLPDQASVLIINSGESEVCTIEDLTLVGGRGSLQQGNRLGGAILIQNSSPSLRRLEIIDSEAELGGGIYLKNSETYIERNRIERNVAIEGGGIYLEESPDVLIRGSLIHANEASSKGGGLMVNEGVKLTESLIQGNTAYRGGAVSIANGGPQDSVYFYRLWIQGNSAVLGGGIELSGGSGLFERIVLAGNASRIGGGAYISSDQSTEWINLTVTQNRAPSWATLRVRGDGIPQIRNSILFNNSNDQLAGEITYSLVQSPEFQKGTNQGGFPLFHLANGEWLPCESVSEPGCVPIRWTNARPPKVIARSRFQPGIYSQILGSATIDAGDPRDSADPDDSRRDQGAIPIIKPARGFIRGDVDGDADIGILDVRVLLGLLHPDSGVDALVKLNCQDSADYNDDGRIDLLDAYLIATYVFEQGPQPQQPFPECSVDLTNGEGLGCFKGSAACPDTE